MSSSVVTMPRIQKHPTCTQWWISLATSTVRRINSDSIRARHHVHLFRNHRLKANNVRAYLEALRFVFVAVLKRPWTVLDTPYPKQPKTLPVVLSQEEVTRLIEGCLTPLDRLILMTLYATGLRRTELTQLKIQNS